MLGSVLEEAVSCLGTGIDQQSSLDKFVLIAWCGEGVPESRKGLFRRSSSSLLTAAARHVQSPLSRQC